MNIVSIIVSFILTFIVFLIVDMIWLGVIARKIYKKHLGSLLSDKVNWAAAFIFYIIYVIGILIFVVYPAVDQDSVLFAIFMGVLLGILTYSTYDLTNLATLKGWPIKIVFIDIAWGALLSAIVSLCGFYIVKWIH